MNLTSDASINPSLLSRFNDKDCLAFNELYNLFYRELYLYANAIYRDNFSGEDVIQDAFLAIWEKQNLKFESLNQIKTYLYISIKNRFLLYCRKNKYIDKQREKIVNDNTYFVTQAIEAELFSIIPDVLSLLPGECSESFRLFLEGEEIKDIAQKLNKTQSAIYKQREKAISILKKRLPKDVFVFVLQSLMTT